MYSLTTWRNDRVIEAKNRALRTLAVFSKVALHLPTGMAARSLVLTGLLVASFIAVAGNSAGAEKGLCGGSSELVESAVRVRDYSFGWWLNGFRKEPGDSSPNVFCIETGYYGFMLDVGKFDNCWLGRIDGPGYTEALKLGSRMLAGLPRVEFDVEIEHCGTVYRATSCLAGRTGDLRNSILLESGRFVQHYRFPGIEFRDESGKLLETNARLELVAWPACLVVLADIAPDYAYSDGYCPGIAGAARVVCEKPVFVSHRPELDPQRFTVELWVKVPERLAHRNQLHWLIGKNGNQFEDGNFGLLLNRDNLLATINIGGGPKAVYRLVRHHALRPGRWYHLAMTYDDRRLRLFVNGRAVGSLEIGRVRRPGSGPLCIGNRPDGRGKPVQAVFDEVRIWNRALSPAEIAKHAARGDYPQQGLVLQIDFDKPEANGRWLHSAELGGARIRIRMADKSVETQSPADWKPGQWQRLTLCYQFDDTNRSIPSLRLSASSTTGAGFSVRYREDTAAYVIDVPDFPRTWKTGYTDIRNYDELILRVENQGSATRYVPVLFDIHRPANITGLVPILCDADGVPTGIPVQLSKNWHAGSYAKLYCIVPAPLGETLYRLRIAYGFWGTLPSASHAQLSLFGYGGNGRWDQLAIGCWGETMCLDVDNSCTPHMITDVRMLMTRNGPRGRMWSWSDGGWGGDWLGVFRTLHQKLFPVEMKTAYLSHGPCLTKVRYAGYYGKARDVFFEAQVSTLRTDDYNRVLQRLTYRFQRPVPAKGAYFFKMGPTNNLFTPRIAWGNRDGLIGLEEVPVDLRPGEIFKADTVLRGEGPWWVAFPGSILRPKKDWGTGSRALIIRSFKAVLNGKTYTNPAVSFPVQVVDQSADLVGCNLEVVCPRQVEQFLPGDTVEIYVEWITVPNRVEDYYGPNRAFRRHLEEHPASWETVYREAVGNDLEVKVVGGKLITTYPIVISTEAAEVKVTIRGGVGAVPICFQGLPCPTGYVLCQIRGGNVLRFNQAVHGKDFWQTTYNPGSETYSITFNLPLDDYTYSEWLFRKEHSAKTAAENVQDGGSER